MSARPCARVGQLLPAPLEPRRREKQHEGPRGVRHVGAQGLAQRGQPEPFGGFAPAQTEGDQGPQEARKARGVRAGRLGQIGGGARPGGEVVGQAEDGHGADGLGGPVSHSHLRYRRPGRQVIRTRAHLASLTAAARARRPGLRSPSPEIEVITTHPSRSLFPPTTMMPGCQARRTRRKGYSPDCVEGGVLRSWYAGCCIDPSIGTSYRPSAPLRHP